MKKEKQIEKTLNGGWYTIKEEKRLVTYTIAAKDAYYTGRAIASPEDEFDVEKGKRIAKLRAIIALKKGRLADLRTDKEFIENSLLSDKLRDKVVKQAMEMIGTYEVSIKNLEDKIAEAASGGGER